MIQQLSILIPVKDNRCLPLVQALARQADNLAHLQYEIVVADDGSVDADIIRENRQTELFPHGRYIRREQNIGRAAIRNYLARQARYPWLLFLDCDVLPAYPDFLACYLRTDAEREVVCGGIVIPEDECLKSNLRYRYEKRCEPTHMAAHRQKAPYQSFRTTNFLVQKQVLLRCPFDEHIKTYGYEDVLWGKTLREQGHGITHIDNGVTLTHFEDNRTYLAKTREALATLNALGDTLTDYSPLLRATIYIYKVKLAFFLTYFFRLFCGCLEQHLQESRKPNLLIFKFYKVGMLMSMRTRR